MGLAHLPNPEPQTSQPLTYTTSHKNFIKANHILPTKNQSEQSTTNPNAKTIPIFQQDKSC